MNEVPDGTVNLYGHVHNNEPLREGPYVPWAAALRLAGRGSA